MSELPDAFDPEECARYLRELAAMTSPILPIGEAALALASYERPRVGLLRYRQHLQTIARDVGRHVGAQGDHRGDLAARARALNEIILLKYGYSGDELTYDDLQNANLMRVVDRRKGLPVALGILYLDAARAQGWDSVGLGFPGHFLVRLTEGAERLILDPFHGGRVCDAVSLRELLKVMAGQDVELAPEHYARLGNMRAAVNALEEFISRAPEGDARYQAAAILQQLKSKLN